MRGQPVALQRDQRQHGGVAGGADRHGLFRGEALGQRHQPVALEAGALGIGAEMGLADAPAGHHHPVSVLVVGVLGGFDDAGAVDAGDHREAAHHRHPAGHGEPVLVVEAGMGDAHGDVARHQVGLVEVPEGQALRLLTLGLVHHPCLEGRHSGRSRFSSSRSGGTAAPA